MIENISGIEHHPQARSGEKGNYFYQCSLSSYEDSQAKTLATAGTYYAIDNNWTVGIETGAGYAVGETDGTITIGNKGQGIYLVSFGLSMASDKVCVVEGAVYVDGVEQQKLSFREDFQATGKYQTIRATNSLFLEAGEEITIKCKSTVNSTALTVQNSSLIINRTGNMAVPPPGQPTGGTITTDGDYTIHTFTSNGTFTSFSTFDVEYLVIAGGGGGGYYAAGGGGAGGYRTDTGHGVTAQGYSITVGAGGGNGDSGTPKGSDGSDSVFDTITSDGGGGGGGRLDEDGSAGGSGGGGAEYSNGSGGAGTAGQGYAGGEGYGAGTPWRGGGGGGASEVGVRGLESGDGGDGLSSSINGSATTRAGGGGGGTAVSSGGTGGDGGGGNGSQGSSGSNGTANTGGGGGGGGSAQNGGDGGSGVVIIRFLTV